LTCVWYIIMHLPPMVAIFLFRRRFRTMAALIPG